MSKIIAICVFSLFIATQGPAETAGPLHLDVQETLLGKTPFATKALISLKSASLEDDADVAFPEISNWQFQFFDSNHVKVDFIQGRGTPSFTSFLWRGITHDGTILEDGFYLVRFIWNDTSGVTHTTPAADLSVLTPPGMQELVKMGVNFAFHKNDAILRLPESLTFPQGQVTLMPTSLNVLTAVADFLLKHHDNILEIHGYTDNTGTDAVNERISSMRAHAVYRFLVEKGLDPTRMTYAGFGALNPIASNAAEGPRAKNRRVEIAMKNAGA
ncbi:MAG: OmpA family protein [Elusimicrobiota bacterium]